VHDTVNASFGPDTQSDFDAGGLRYAQNIVNLDASHDFSVGFAKPLTFAAGAEYRHEQFAERPGDFQSWAIGPFFRSSITNTTLANCNIEGGVFNATTNVCSFPGRAAPAGAQGFPASRQQPDQ
jgi:iron complex outermembrane receptor protein